MLPKCETKDDKKTAIPLKPESTLEESKQTQNEAQKDDSLKKSIISTGNLIFMKIDILMLTMDR